MRGPRPSHVTIIRYVDSKGRRVTKGTPGAKRIREESDTYYATIKIDGKKTRVSLATDDEQQAWLELRKILRREADRRAGIYDESQEHAARSLSEHVEDWLRTVSDKGTSSGQYDLLRTRVLRLAELANWRSIASISADSCLAGLAKLQRDGGSSAQTRNHYLSAAKQFARWLVEADRLPKHPLLRLKPISVESDRRHDRRVPTDEEIGMLLASVDLQPIRNGMTGQQRFLGYQISMATGLRAGELRSLNRESFDLDVGTVAVLAGYSKRRRLDSQPLPAWLIEELRKWFSAGGGFWVRFPKKFPGRLLLADLTLAGVEWSVPSPSGPLFFDFHSLRHWYCTWAANQPGISPKTLMSLCRHSTPTLTLKTYAKSRSQDLHSTVGQMQRPGKTSEK